MNDDIESSTRSVKYKKIQEELDKENAPVKTKAELKRERKKREEELYLTTSLKPLRKRLTLKKSVKRVLRVILLAVVLFSFCHFIALPLYHKYLDSRPKAIIDNSIDYVFDNIETYLNLSDDDLSLNITNSEDGVVYGYALASNGNEYVDNLYMLEDENNYGITKVIKKDGSYEFVNNSSKYVELSNNNKTFNLRNIYSNFNYSKEDMIYLIKTKKEMVKAIIKDEYIKSNRQDLEVNGKSMKVRKNSLQLDKKNSKTFYEDYIKEVTSNSKYLGIVSKAKGISEEEYKAFLEKELLNDLKEISFNIYTINGDEFVGFDYEVNGFRQIYYYNVKDKMIFYISLEEGKYTFNINGIKKKDVVEATVKCNEKLLGDITIRSNTLEKIDFDYKLNINGKNSNGSLLYELDKEQKTATIKITNNNSEKSVNANGTINYKRSNLLDYDLEDKKKVSAEDYNDELNDLKSSIKYNRLDYELYSNWNSFVNDPLGFILPTKKG